MLSQITKTSLRRIGSTDPLTVRQAILATCKNVAWKTWMNVNNGRLTIADLEKLFETWWRSVEESR